MNSITCSSVFSFQHLTRDCTVLRYGGAKHCDINNIHPVRDILKAIMLKAFILQKIHTMENKVH